MTNQTNRINRKNSTQTKNSPAILENLESRQFLSTAPLTVATQATTEGTALVVWGTAGADDIYVSRNGSAVRISNGQTFTRDYTGAFARVMIVGGEGNDRIAPNANLGLKLSIWGQGGNDNIAGANLGDYIDAGAGNDRVQCNAGDDIAFGGDGNDAMFGAAGYDQLVGQAGNDTFVTIGGGTTDRAWGGDGYDSFWTDANSTEGAMDLSATESAYGANHRVGAFLAYNYRASNGGVYYYGTSKELLGQNLPDPVASTNASRWLNYSSWNLFSGAGPTADDVKQGEAGTCYLMAALSSIARVSPDRIRQTITDLGDGTFAVQFNRNGQNVFVRVDGDLPVRADGSLVYAKWGPAYATWTPFIEKAFACFRQGVNNFASWSNTNNGWLEEGLNTLGGKSVYASGHGQNPFSNGSSMWTWIKNQLASGRVVTFDAARAYNGSPFVYNHVYSVVATTTDSSGRLCLVLRNPWASDGPVIQGANDGYITVTVDQAMYVCAQIASANP